MTREQQSPNLLSRKLPYQVSVCSYVISNNSNLLDEHQTPLYYWLSQFLSSPSITKPPVAPESQHRSARRARSIPAMVGFDDEGMHDRPAALVLPASGPSASTSETHVLTREHILDAIARSSDEGCTLDFSNKKLVDVGDAGVDDLIQLGKADDVLDECQVLRWAIYFL